MNTTTSKTRALILSTVALIVLTVGLSTTTPYTDQRLIIEVFGSIAFIGCFMLVVTAFCITTAYAEIVTATIKRPVLLLPAPIEQPVIEQPVIAEQPAKRPTVKAHIKTRIDSCGQPVYQISFNGVFICEYYTLRIVIRLITEYPTIDTMLRHKRLAYFRQRNNNLTYTAAESRVIINNLITAYRTTIGA